MRQGLAWMKAHPYEAFLVETGVLLLMLGATWRALDAQAGPMMRTTMNAFDVILDLGTWAKAHSAEVMVGPLRFPPRWG